MNEWKGVLQNRQWILGKFTEEFENSVMLVHIKSTQGIKAAIKETADKILKENRKTAYGIRQALNFFCMCRTNTLKWKGRNIFIYEETQCEMCGGKMII